MVTPFWLEGGSQCHDSPVVGQSLHRVVVQYPCRVARGVAVIGATRWQTVRLVLLRKSAPGLLAAVVLAVSRTMGETIAVLMVCGNLAIVPTSLLNACYPLPALIAKNYGEMLSLPLYERRLCLLPSFSFFVVLLFNLASRIVLRQVSRYGRNTVFGL